MVIFNKYTTSDVLFDIPYVDKTLKLYPLKVKDYLLAEEGFKYILLSKKYLKLDNNVNLFEFIIGSNIASRKEKKSDKSEEYILLEVLDELVRFFSIICRETIYLDNEMFESGKEIILVNKSKTIKIDRNNFEKARIIILKQNGVREPKIFENKLEEHLAEKYKKAMQKKQGHNISDLGEIANFVSCYTGKSYDHLYNQNVFQLYCDYYRCVSIDTHRANIIFATVSEKPRLNGLTEEIISRMFEDPYSGLWKNFESFGFA